MHKCESWTIKAESWRMDAFELWCWKRLLRVPWTARRSNQSIFRQSSLNVHWKDWCWNWSSNSLATWWEELTHWKRPWCWDRLRREKKGTTEDEMVGWHHQFNGWVWANSRRQWRAEKPGALQSIGCRVRHDSVTEHQQFSCLLDFCHL